MLLEREDEESALHDFFAGIQHHFYADNADPGQWISTARSARRPGWISQCSAKRFASEKCEVTYAEFNMGARVGRQRLPHGGAAQGQGTAPITSGYATGKALVYATGYPHGGLKQPAKSLR